MRTKREIVEEIRVQAYGGMPDVNASITPNFVLRLLNNRIAEAAVKQGYANYQLDGCICVDDIFTLSFTGITLSTDSVTGNKYFTLPAQPIGLPNKRSMYIYPPANRGGVMSSIFKPISRTEVTKVRDLPKIRKVFHYTADGNEYFIDSFQIMDSYTTVNLDIVSAGANDLDAFLNMPDDMITAAKVSIVAELRQMMGLMDTTPLPISDQNQPRGGGV